MYQPVDKGIPPIVESLMRYAMPHNLTNIAYNHKFMKNQDKSKILASPLEILQSFKRPSLTSRNIKHN